MVNDVLHFTINSLSKIQKDATLSAYIVLLLQLDVSMLEQG